MSSHKQRVTIRDLAEEAKKRIVFLAISVVGLSYIMSLTSSSVWFNLPAASCLIIILRYISLDLETKRKSAAYNSKPSSANNPSQKKPVEGRKVVDKSEWRRKVNSPVAESAIDQFTRRIVSEWVTDLWYGRLTPDKEGPEELVYIMNGVLGEFSARARNINLIDLLTRDLINLICSHLELFRVAQVKIEKQAGVLTIEQRDTELRLVMASDNKLHPALFSPEAEHKVLQHVMDGLISFTFKPEDLQCSFFRYVTRELLACAVMRPVLNLATPRFINERIENVFINTTKSKQAASAASVAHDSAHKNSDRQAKLASDEFTRFLDPSVTGVELVQLKKDQSKKKSGGDEHASNVKDPLLSIDTHSTRSWNSLPMDQTNEERGIQRHRSGGEWGDMLDIISHRKTEALAPEHFENMWTKGRDYKRTDKDDRPTEHAPRSSAQGKLGIENDKKAVTNPKENLLGKKHTDQKKSNSSRCAIQKLPNVSLIETYAEDDEKNPLNLGEKDLLSSTSYTSEEDKCVMGLDSPGTKVWDAKNNRNTTVAQIHHPLENHVGRRDKKAAIGHTQYQRLQTAPSRKRSRSSNNRGNIWQEIERTSFLSGDGQDILGSSKLIANNDDSTDDSDTGSLGRAHSGLAASSSEPAESEGLAVNSLKKSLAVDSFYKLRCEVLGANIVKSGSRTFAVYSISVTDVNNHSWSIKRRFRHFEELHRRLKMFSEYNLHLPPKHFLSSGLDIPVIRERSILLDNYLKRLMQLPTVSGSIEVWDFLSVDSQTYFFSNSFSIIDTLSVDVDGKSSDKSKGIIINGVPLKDEREHTRIENGEPALQVKNNVVADGFRLNEKTVSYFPTKKPGKEFIKPYENSGTDPEIRAKNDSSLRNLEKTKGRANGNQDVASELLHDAATEPTFPTEWVPPNLSVPILDLVDCIFQLQDGGWIRRKAFWVAKQVLQLGMGDAFDDWLIEKIQLLRKGSVVASGFNRLEQILWPDGIFLTKHPKRRPPVNPSPSSPSGRGSSPRMVDDEQQKEADRRAKFVYELMIENAPAAIVGLVGRREYEQCAKDLYFFLQSSVCVKQLAYDLLELLLLSTFPKMDYIFKQLHDEKYKYGEFK